MVILRQAHSTRRMLKRNWQGSAAASESTLHQLSPYIGKLKSSMAASLVSLYTKDGGVVYDPFSGSGTVALEAWIAGRSAIANDLNPYALLLTKAKLFPYSHLDEALHDVEIMSVQVQRVVKHVDLRKVPKWVRAFFDLKTLRETIAWVRVLQRSNKHFLLACLMGILHHQRPGFLSYPSSHSVPYLRSKKFPPETFPELYSYRNVQERLEAKVKRAMKRVPRLNFDLRRTCCSKNASKLIPASNIDTIITSPPYMRSLDYARDNRLRLWFLGSVDWRNLDTTVSPNEYAFIRLMSRCLEVWKDLLRTNAHCVIVSGDRFSRTYKKTIPNVITQIATKEVGGYELVAKYREKIPEARRVRRRHSGNSSETILVFQRLQR